MSLDEKKVFHEDVEEEKVLEELGYQQELKRSFGLFGMIGFAFSIVTSWTALGGVLIVGVESGGPPVMIYSWIAVSIFGLAVAYSMAEMCSAYPIAGGQYSWVAVISPPKIARGMSWVTGWFMIVGILAMGASWPGQPVFSKLYHRALAYHSTSLLDRLHTHGTQHIRPTLSGPDLTFHSHLEYPRFCHCHHYYPCHKRP